MNLNQTPRSRFTKGLSSGLSILALFAVGYSINERITVVSAADKPSISKSQSSTGEESIESSSAAQQEARQSAEAIIKGNPTTETEEADLHDFEASAYCLKGKTSSGEPVKPGVIAADPKVLPIGTVVHIRAGEYTGKYTVLDTGGRIKGKKVDIYFTTYREAVRFGRRPVKIKVLGRRVPQRIQASAGNH